MTFVLWKSWVTQVVRENYFRETAKDSYHAPVAALQSVVAAGIASAMVLVPKLLHPRALMDPKNCAAAASAPAKILGAIPTLAFD